MSGIFASISAGGVALPNNSVQYGADVSAPFIVTCELLYLPSDCTAKILPSQINAFTSEMLNLAQCLDPDGTWDCSSLDNLCVAFTNWSVSALAAKADSSWVTAQINAVIGAAPGALDTLNELAAALGNDASFSTTMITALALKAPLSSPTFTGTPIAPTAAANTNSTQIATTAYADAIAALKANLDSPGFTGVPTAPTAVTTTNTTQLATTAFVQQEIAANVDSWTYSSIVATTSGTTWDFTGLPVGVTEVDIILDGYSDTAATDARIRIGPSGGVETTGYKSNSVLVASPASISDATGFAVNAPTSAASITGILELRSVSAGKWRLGGFLTDSNSNAVVCSGYKTITGDLSIIRFMVAGVGSGDGGSIQIRYR